MTSAVQKSPADTPQKRSFRQQMHLAREDAIVSAVNRLLAEKGFDAMTVDEVAAEVGIAKASLYKHFPSKEDLAAAAMVRVMDRARAFLDTLDTTRAPLELLRDVARWTMEVQLAGEMPSLPSANSSEAAAASASASRRAPSAFNWVSLALAAVSRAWATAAWAASRAAFMAVS